MNQQTQQAAGGRRRAGILKSLQAGLSQPTPPRISIRAQRFSLVDGAGVQIPVNLHDPQYGLYLDVVIIGANENKSKIFYENEYDPNVEDMPVCWSDNGIGPSAQSSKPQSPTCAGCPNNEWGSDVSKMTGKPTKLCQDKKKLAVLAIGDPNHPATKLVYQLQIPPATLKNMAVYAQHLMTYSVPDEENPGQQRPCDPADIVTRIYFNPQKQGELLFQPMGFWSQMAPYIGSLIAQADASNVIDVVTGANDVPWSGANAIAGPSHQTPQIGYQQPPQVPQMQPPPPMHGYTQNASQQGQAPQSYQQPMNTGPLPVAPNAPGAMPQGGYQMAAPNGGQHPQMQAPQGAPPPARQQRGGARSGAGRPRRGANAQQQAPAPQQPQQPGFAGPMQAPQQPQQPAPAFQMQPAPAAAPQPMQAPFAQGAAVPDAPAFLNATGNPQQPGFAGPMQAPQQGYQQAAQPTQAYQQPGPQGGAYGMQNGVAPPPDLNAALENAFGAPLQPRPRG